MQPIPNVDGLALINLQELRARSGWIIAMGVLLIILGCLALGSTFLVSVFTVIYVGVTMLVGGVLEVGHAFVCKKWSGFFIDLLSGIVYMVVGLMLIASPARGAVAFTLLIAMFLMISGLFRLILLLYVRHPHWVWVALHGLVTLLLGISIWTEWPLSGMWVIGMFVAIDLLLNGWSLVMLGIAAKH